MKLHFSVKQQVSLESVDQVDCLKYELKSIN